MSSEFTAYLLITSFFWLAALMVIGPRRTIDLSRCVGWYFLVFYLTYMLRPMASQIMGDTTMFDLVEVGSLREALGSDGVCRQPGNQLFRNRI